MKFSFPILPCALAFAPWHIPDVLRKKFTPSVKNSLLWLPTDGSPSLKCIFLMFRILPFKLEKLRQRDRFKLHSSNERRSMNTRSLHRNTIYKQQKFQVWRIGHANYSSCCHAGFVTGTASVCVDVTDRSSSSELDSPRKCERIALAEA